MVSQQVDQDFLLIGISEHRYDGDINKMFSASGSMILLHQPEIRSFWNSYPCHSHHTSGSVT